MNNNMEGFSENIQKLFNEIVEKNLISSDELNKRIKDCAQKLSENESLHILDNFLNVDHSTIEDKENYLYDSFQDHITSSKTEVVEKEIKPVELLVKEHEPIQYLQENIKDISNKEKILELLNRTGYILVLSTGQRRYGGPPPSWSGPPPGCGEEKFCSQVHIGKLERNMFEDTLVPVLELHGRIYQLRIMVNPQTGESKGYAFCDFFTKEEAHSFIKDCNEKQIFSYGSPITATLSIPKCRLHVGGFTTQRSKEEVEREFKIAIPSVSEVTAFSYRENKKRNRGFAFLNFNSHNEASMVKKQVSSGKIALFSQILRRVEWAEPPNDASEVTITDKRRIFVRFGSMNLTEEKIKDLFIEFGDVQDIRRLETYAFLTFSTSDAANNAVNLMNKKLVDGIILEVGYAKKASDDPSGNMRKRRRHDRYPPSKYYETDRRRDDYYPRQNWREPYSPPSRRMPPAYNDFHPSQHQDIYPREDYRAPYRYPNPPRSYRQYSPPPLQKYPQYPKESYPPQSYYDNEANVYNSDRRYEHNQSTSFASANSSMATGPSHHDTNPYMANLSSGMQEPIQKNVYHPTPAVQSSYETHSRPEISSYRPYTTTSPSTYQAEQAGRYPPVNQNFTPVARPPHQGGASYIAGYPPTPSSNMKYW